MPLAPNPLDQQLPQLGLGNDEPEQQQFALQAEEPEETPESERFRALPREMQRRLLLEYPRALANAVHRYGEGANCESILLAMFESTADMLRIRNREGDNPMASALARGQAERADKLVDIAITRSPSSLDDRTTHQESLLMLSTSSSSAGNVMERLLIREPSQLHRLYDNDGRNFLHHCALEESVEALQTGLELTKRLLREGHLAAGNVAAAIHMNDRAGDTIMHMMASRNRADMLHLLMQFARGTGIGVNLDERRHTGRRRTPLMSAAEAGALEAAQFLLANGADPDETDSEGATAADLADTAQLQELFPKFANPKFPNSDEDIAMEVDQSDAAKQCNSTEAAGCHSPWLTAVQAPVTSVDSGLDSVGVSSSASWLTTASSAADPTDPEMSAADLEDFEARLAASGKCGEFFSALSKLDGRLTADELAHLTDRPLSAAFYCWSARELRVPRRLLLAALEEISN